ncbi:tryptophan 2,3-dioxygenase family protein [Nonomuraea mangrovi]|uniref:Tryptophan 2,3-dioxygenase family protein n=1 Tax=Nonomuraea mangrovi TaxID=2316207 RepID=A0ABW4TCD6_9ACTN
MTDRKHACGAAMRLRRDSRASRLQPADGQAAGVDGMSLARVVTDQVRREGKHFLPECFLGQLAAVRAQHTGLDPFLDAFLDCVLDKYEDRFWNRTYLALPLLELLQDERYGGLSPARLSTLLVSDVVRFEIEAATGSSESWGQDRPDAMTLRKRLRHALRFMADDLEAAPADGPPGRTLLTMTESGPEDLLDHLPRPPATGAGQWFDVTVLPVYLLHDEYFFIRVLQTHEMIFTAIGSDLRAAIGALRDGRLDACVARVDHAVAVFERAASLFRMVATMRPEHFSGFRQFTQGASAIQSEQYKRFEILCGPPDAARLRSAAFTSVPVVRAEAEGHHDSLTGVYLELRGEAGFSPAAWAALDAALGRLEAIHQRWKSTHRTLAVRMLGDARGSGDTAGVPYLTQCLGNRLFGRLGEASGLDRQRNGQWR